MQKDKLELGGGGGGGGKNIFIFSICIMQKVTILAPNKAVHSWKVEMKCNIIK